MKRIFAALLASIIAPLALATTLAPVQLLNPAGSTSGQAVVSTGPTTPPTWGNVSAAALTGITPVANGGTGLATLTQYNVMVGNGASAVSLIGPGVAGTIFASNGAASYPSFQTAASLSIALTTGNLSQFSATTSAQLAGVISDETGTGALVFGTAPAISSPSLTGTPTAPTATAGTNTTQIATTAFAQNAVTGGSNAGAFTTLSASGLITPSSTAGIKGTTTNDSAQAGSVGELICAQVTNGGSPTGCATNSSTPVSLTSGVAANVTSISLTAGDWDVDGVVGILPAGTTVLSNSFGGSSSTSAALGQLGTYWQLAPGTSSTGPAYIFAIPHWNYKLTATTSIYCVAQASFGTSTTSAVCYIRARRVR